MSLVNGFALIFAATAADPAVATDASKKVGTIDVPQISRSHAPLPAVPIVPRSADAPTQLGGREQGRPNPLQVSSGARTASASAQLSAGPASALPAPALSRVSEGRTGTAERISGQDRCDPALPKMSSSCQHIVENRAAEFQRKQAPPLSPEQRILIGDEALERAGLANVVRRLASSGGDTSSLEAQGVASIALKSPEEKPRPKDPAVEQATGSALESVVNAILNPDR